MGAKFLLGMGFLKLKLPEERPSRSLQDKGSQAGDISVIHKCFRPVISASLLSGVPSELLMSWILRLSHIVN